MKSFIAVILLTASLAFAQQHQGQRTVVNSNNNNSNSHNTTNTALGGYAGASASNNINMGGGTTSTSVDSSNNVPRLAPPAFAPDVPASAPCRIGASAGGSSPWAGISIGGSKLDKDCAKRELARLLLAAGQRQSAVDVLCTTEAAKDIPYASCHQLEVGPEPMPAPVVAPQPQEVTIHVDPIAFAPLRFEPIAFQPLPPEKPVHVIVEHHAPRKHKDCPTLEK